MQIAIQFTIAVLIGCIAFVLIGDQGNPKVPLLGALIAGVGGQWVVMFIYVWVRFGWSSARYMRMYGND